MTVSAGDFTFRGSAGGPECSGREEVGGARHSLGGDLLRLSSPNACGKSDRRQLAYIRHLTTCFLLLRTKSFSTAVTLHIIAVCPYQQYDYRNTLTAAVARFLAIQIATFARPLRPPTAGPAVSALKHPHHNGRRISCLFRSKLTNA